MKAAEHLAAGDVLEVTIRLAPTQSSASSLGYSGASFVEVPSDDLADTPQLEGREAPPARSEVLQQQ